MHENALAGRVTEAASGRGVAGVRVEIWSAAPYPVHLGSITTESDGSFTLTVRGARHAVRHDPFALAGDSDELAALTPREREVLRLLAEGCSNREIAAALYIAPRTASTHVGNILQKLGLTSRTAAAARALQRGLGTAGREVGVATAN